MPIEHVKIKIKTTRNKGNYMTTAKEVIIEVNNHVGIIKLNRLKALNALSLNMIDAISETMKRWKSDDDIYMVYLSSNHPKSFCAGGDVKSLYEHSMQSDMEYPKLYLAKQYMMDYIIQTYKKPVMVYVDGYVFGGGVGLSIGASHYVVSEHVKFAMPETKIGFFPDVGASYFLNKLLKHIGKYIGVLGQVLNANDLMYLNIAQGIVKHDHLKVLEEKMFTHTFDKENVGHQLSHIISALSVELNGYSEIKDNISSIQKIFTKDTILDMINTIDTHQPFEAKLKNLFEEMSPTAMSFTLELLKRTQELSLFECLKFEHLLSHNVIQTHDFKEGVRSLLVDKDLRFDYSPRFIKDVSDLKIDELFDFDIHHPHVMDDLLKKYEK